MATRTPPEEPAKKAAKAPVARMPLPMSEPAPTDDLKLELARTQEQLTSVSLQRDDLAVRLEAISGKYEEASSALSAQQEELGKLRNVAQQVDGLVQERDGLRAQLDEMRSSVPEQVQEQIDSRLAQLTAAHAAEVAALAAERDRLRARIQEVESGPTGADAAPAMTTTALAGHFADVLAELGNRPVGAGQSFSAAVTGFTVQAKGLLRATSSGEVELVTAGAGAVPAEQLSTVSMDLKLLPRLPGGAPAPERS
jgi:predicted nuclease with TOPRIM domain